MDIPITVQLFIREHEQDINDNNWSKFYDDAYTYFNNDYDIGLMTDMLIQSNINPIEYFFTSIPLSYAYGSKEITSVLIPADIIKLCSGCFYDSNLKYIEFEEGSKLREIQSFAFSLSHIEKIILPEGLKKINMQAFGDIKNLRYIYIPESCTDINNHAFMNATDLTIACKQRSYAARYATELSNIDSNIKVDKI